MGIGRRRQLPGAVKTREEGSERRVSHIYTQEKNEIQDVRVTRWSARHSTHTTIFASLLSSLLSPLSHVQLIWSHARGSWTSCVEAAGIMAPLILPQRTGLVMPYSNGPPSPLLLGMLEASLERIDHELLSNYLLSNVRLE